MRVKPSIQAKIVERDDTKSNISISSGMLYQAMRKALPQIPHIIAYYALSLLWMLYQPILSFINLSISTDALKKKDENQDIKLDTSLVLTNALEAKINQTINEHMEDYHIPSMNIGIVLDGKVVLQTAYGESQKLIPGITETSLNATSDTTYRLASLTKQFTATAIMKLVEQEKVQLDAPVTQYIKGAPDSWQKVTVRDLIHHNGGFAYQLPIAEYPTLVEQDQYPTPESYLRTLTAQEPQPGKHIYSNIGYELLGVIIKEVTQQSYSAFMKDTFFDPLNMTQTSITSNVKNTQNFAVGYAYENEEFTPMNLYPDLVQEDIPLAGAGLSSSMIDLLKWEKALRSNILLTKESQAVLWGEEGEGVWSVGKTEEGNPMLSVSGAGWGYNTSLVRFPAKNAAVIVLGNLNGTGPNGANIPELSTKIAGILRLI